MTGGSFEWALLLAAGLGVFMLVLVSAVIDYHRQPEGERIPVRVERGGAE